MDSIGTARTPSSQVDAARGRRQRPPQGRVEHLAARYEAGLDFWTGRPLTGSDREDWHLLQAIAAGLPLSVDGNRPCVAHAAPILA